MPGAALLPLPGELDALLRWEAADIEGRNMKAETTVVGGLIYRLDTQIPGSASPSSRAATLTPSPKMSPSSTTRSPW
jgi:hypothetical protein